MKTSKRWTGVIIVVALTLALAALILGFAYVIGKSGLAGREGPPRNGFAVTRIVNGSQIVTTTISASSYFPIAVQRGIPVRWTIRAKAKDLNSCNERIVASDLGIEATLVPGKILVEFTPDRTGVFAYTCWMDMITSTILVVEDLSKPFPEIAVLLPPPPRISVSVPTGEIALAKLDGDVQTVNIRLASDGFHPALLVLQRGRSATIGIVPVVDLPPGDAIIEFPGHDIRFDLSSKEGIARFSEVFADFTFRSTSGSALGYVKVVDDLGTVNLDEIRSQVAAYRPADDFLAPCCGY